MTTSTSSADALDDPTVLEPPAPFEIFSRYYDAWYGSKNYAREYDIYRSSLAEAKSIIEYGCGTGEFSRRFVAGGVDVLGVDSCREMVAIARSKGVCAVCGDMASRRFSAPAELALRPQDRQKLCTQRDGAIAPFSTLCYATTNEQLIATLRSIRCRLKLQSRFCFDFTHMAAVLHFLIRHEDESRQVNVSGKSMTIRRTSDKSFCPATSILTYDFRFSVADESGMVEEWEETHYVRPFMVAEIAAVLNLTGFRFLHACQLSNCSEAITRDTWQVFAVAEAV